MIIAYALIMAGVFVLFVFCKTAVSLAVHWRDVTIRRKKILKLIGMTPLFLMGVFLIAFMLRMLLWYYGSSLPTEYFDYPDSNHGEVHYVNGALRLWLWAICIGSAGAFLLPAVLVEIMKRFRRGRRALRSAVSSFVSSAAPRPQTLRHPHD